MSYYQPNVTVNPQVCPPGPQPGFIPQGYPQPVQSGQYKGLPQWVPSSHGQVPPGAVRAGEDNGQPLFVARALHQNRWTVGKLHPSHRSCYISYGGKEHGYPNYEVLTNPYGVDLSWVTPQGNQQPPGVLQGGEDNQGVPLFVGRAKVRGGHTPGKVNPNMGKCFVPYGGKEEACGNYEVLVVRSHRFY